MEFATPKVYLITRPSIDLGALNAFRVDEGLLEWDAEKRARDGVSDGEHACEVAGRLCYMSFGKGRNSNRDFLSNIISAGHGSVLEHANYGIIITGVSRSFTHELVRHRHLSYSQLSQRYVDESKARLVFPAALGGAEDVFERVISTINTAYSIFISRLETRYKDIADVTSRRKLARQAARCVLSNATETKIYVTGNARAWRHFVEMRASIHADTEIREVAVKIFALLKLEAPSIFEDYEVHDDIVVPLHRKV